MFFTQTESQCSTSIAMAANHARQTYSKSFHIKHHPYSLVTILVGPPISSPSTQKLKINYKLQSLQKRTDF